MATVSKLLAQKLCVIMGAVGNIPKTGWNPNQRYKYVTDADISEALRKAMHEVGVVMLPNVREHSYRTIKTSKGTEMQVNTVIMDFLLVDAETGESVPISTVGEGMDTGDKGVYKAMTGATKYALMKSFQVSTGDDPENDKLTGDGDNAQHSQPTTPAPGKLYMDPPAGPGRTQPQAADPNAVVTFGKFKGQRWADVEDGYLEWLAEKGTKPEFKAAANAELLRRANAEFDMGDMGDEVDNDPDNPYGDNTPFDDE